MCFSRLSSQNKMGQTEIYISSLWLTAVVAYNNKWLVKKRFVPKTVLLLVFQTKKYGLGTA